LHNADGGKSDYRHEGKKFGSHKIFLCPAGITFLRLRVRNGRRTQRGEVLRRFQIRLATYSFEKSRQLVKNIRRKPESPLQVQETQSVSPRYERQTSFRCPDARRRRRLFVRENPTLTRSSTPPALLRLSAMISQYFTRAELCLFCSPHDNAKDDMNCCNGTS
jgi:hypothetical protein